MASPKKAAPSEKNVKFGAQQYRVLERSFINGDICLRGETVSLPEGVKAGSNLEPIRARDDKPGD